MSAITPRTVEVVIYQGDDLAELRRLSLAMSQAESEAGPGKPRMLGDADPVREAAKAYDDFVTEAAERATGVRLQQVGRRRWREVRDACPPRSGNEDDKVLGYNPEAVAEELIPESIIEPVLPKPAQTAMLDSLSEADWDRLTDALIAVNTAQVGDPKAVSAVSVLDRMSDASSKQPDPSA